MTSHANKYMKLTGNKNMFIFSMTTVVSMSKIIVNKRDMIPICKTFMRVNSFFHRERIILEVKKNDRKLQIGTVDIERNAGNC